jgi:hypothetical protein
LGYEKMREFTDDMGNKVAAKDPARLTHDSTGSLWTDGSTAVESGRPSFFGETVDRVLSPLNEVIGKATMSEQGYNNHWYNAAWLGGPSNPIARFVNQVSKAHDFWNGWNYNHATGEYISRGAAFDAGFNLYSFSGMVPMAGFTAAALSPATSNLYLSGRDAGSNSVTDTPPPPSSLSPNSPPSQASRNADQAYER